MPLLRERSPWRTTTKQKGPLCVVVFHSVGGKGLPDQKEYTEIQSWENYETSDDEDEEW